MKILFYVVLACLLVVLAIKAMGFMTGEVEFNFREVLSFVAGAAIMLFMILDMFFLR